MPKKRVLLVEDEKGLLVSLSDRLLSEGYVVQGAADGRSGYETGLRRKIEPDPRCPRYLLTVHHRGYKFVG